MTFPETAPENSENELSDGVLEDASRNPDIEKMHQGDELDGQISRDQDDQRLPHSVLEVDTNNIDDGMLVEEAFNQNLSSFLPDMMFKEMVNNYKNAKQLYGETIIRELSGYDPRFIDKNARIPEFQRELKRRLEENVKSLQDKGILKKNGTFTKDAINTAALFLIDEELQETDNSYSSFGEPVHKVAYQIGERSDVRLFKPHDPYKDVATRQTVSRAIRRGHTEITRGDLHSYDREARQQVNVVYALDISGSMKGDKIRLARRAGVSLAHRAIRDQNKVGLILFDSKVEDRVSLTKDLLTFVHPLASITPGSETDIALAIRSATQLLDKVNGIRHIVILTDGLHTTSADPSKIVLEAVALAESQKITISIVGIHLDDIGLDLARQVVDHSKGKLYAVNDVAEVGGIVIADYNALL